MTYDDLIRTYKTQKGIGEALIDLIGQKVAQSTIAGWKETGIPIMRQAQFEIASKGRLKADRPSRKAA